MLNFSPRHKSYSFTKRVYATKNPDLVTNIFFLFFFFLAFFDFEPEDVVVQRCGCSKMWLCRFEGFKSWTTPSVVSVGRFVTQSSSSSFPEIGRRFLFPLQSF